jgi:hypothetical protein
VSKSSTHLPVPSTTDSTASGEFVQGATIDERCTVLTLGRAAFVLLGRGQRGEQDRDLWRAGDALFPVAPASARPDPADRCQPVVALPGAWQDARGNERPRPG